MSVLSNDGAAMTTKLKRIADRARGDTKCVFTNVGHVIDMELLAASFHELDERKAVGVDGITKEIYGSDLIANLSELLVRIRRGSYRPQPSRIVEIPKDDGGKRPLAIACLEDKIVQLAVSKILTAIYEPTFLPCSFGFRPNRGAHDAVRELVARTKKVRNGALIEIDIKRYFNTIPHQKLLAILIERLKDKRFMKLIKTLLESPTSLNGITTATTDGVPQGSIASPVLANIYLHVVLDIWFEHTVKPILQDQAWLVRYADDATLLFRDAMDAERVYQVLGKRFNKYGLELHSEKTKLLPHGPDTIKRLKRDGSKCPTFQFLGFQFYWGLAKSGEWYRLKAKSRKDRYRNSLKEVKLALKRKLNSPNTSEVLKWVAAVARGWLAYHNVSDNQGMCFGFLWRLRKTIHRWFNRRGSKTMNWETLVRILAKNGFPDRLPPTISLFTVR